MPTIAFTFPTLPADADPNRVDFYQRTYKALQRKGLAVPGTEADQISRADLLLHLQTVAGQIVRDELDNDPANRGYGALSNADAATAINEHYMAVNGAPGQRFPEANQQGYVTLAGSTDVALLAERRPSGGDPGFDTFLLASTGIPRPDAFIRFRMVTPTVGLRGKLAKVQAVTASNAIALGTKSPIVIPAGEIFDLGRPFPDILPPRLVDVLLGVPWGPRQLTEADIAAARS